MACFVEGWIWEPVDSQILRCALDGTRFPSRKSYLWQAEVLEREGFIMIGHIEGDRMSARLTSKGLKAAEKLFRNG